MLDLQDLIDSMDMQFDEMDSYLDKKTMSIICVTSEEIYGADDIEDMDEFEELYGDRFIRIPSQYDINEYSIMEDFIETLPENIQGEFYIAINGRGAFRRFKDMARYKGVEKQWYSFKEQKLRDIAIEWCKGNNIPYKE